jgi:sugar phosphate isomerase/epimerase
VSAQPEINYELLPDGRLGDETDTNLRAYLSRLSDAHLAEYRPHWTDEQVVAWDGNFRSDGNLMLVCCERDVDVKEFRHVLKEHLQRRGLCR